jgi:protein-S-isoprenylcysteine O-methyltransferase Ste14
MGIEPYLPSCSKENTFTSRISQVEAGQKVISTGPYALVRHPMYLGALVMLLRVLDTTGGREDYCGRCLVVRARIEESSKRFAR